MKSKRISMIIIILVIVMLNSNCIVWDIAKETLLKAEKELKKINWGHYLDIYGKIVDINENIKLAFDFNKSPVKPGVIKLFKENKAIEYFDLKEELEEKVSDISDFDWSVLWNKEQSINDLFPDLFSYPDLNKNPLYLEDKTIRAYVDKGIKQYEESILELNGYIDFIFNVNELKSNIKEFGEFGKLDEIQQTLLGFARKGQEGKLESFIAFTELKILLIDELLSIADSMTVETSLKSAVNKKLLEQSLPVEGER